MLRKRKEGEEGRRSDRSSKEPGAVKMERKPD